MFEAIEKALAKFKAALDAVRNSKKTPEQIEKAKELYDSLDPGDRTLLEYIFPEVVEIEDERIRKELIGFIDKIHKDNDVLLLVADMIGDDIPNMIPSCIAYLERQKEQKGSLRVIKDASEWEKIKEQKPVEWAFTFDDVLALCSASAMAMANSDKKLYDALKSIFERVYDAYHREQKPAEWSEEDNKAIHLACEFIRHHATKGDSIGGIDCSELINLLKSLRPQPKQEWSDEDESYLQTVINEMEANKKEAREYEHKKYDTIILWLKSLRPQPHWKPSEEQMNALADATMRDVFPKGNREHLESLYNDLKKL